ncbi:DinB family protein [Massilia sp. NR 4-1]|uniref:DinB family protein n=1 Tax=Massilia sp. NR 4-1 TaxID=1678028 RepID=UPI00067DCFDE|nr:DinB family protein [Massilia sp. NR 4-1]AKU22803.1 diguanylate cyclase [Massilia sp. NR 4-1]
MNRTEQFRLLAKYNEWMNLKLYEAAASLPAEARQAERGAFFGSLHGTLQHIVAADTIWLRRFGSHARFADVLADCTALPQPPSLQGEEMEFEAMRARRVFLDRQILQWTDALGEDDLDQTLQYRSMNGSPGSRPMDGLLLHFFNHQTHHRGQATTLLSQAGADVGATDLLILVADI